MQRMQEFVMKSNTPVQLPSTDYLLLHSSAKIKRNVKIDREFQPNKFINCFREPWLAVYITLQLSVKPVDGCKGKHSIELRRQKTTRSQEGNILTWKPEILVKISGEGEIEYSEKYPFNKFRVAQYYLNVEGKCSYEIVQAKKSYRTYRNIATREFIWTSEAPTAFPFMSAAKTESFTMQDLKFSLVPKQQTKIHHSYALMRGFKMDPSKKLKAKSRKKWTTALVDLQVSIEATPGTNCTLDSVVLRRIELNGKNEATSWKSVAIGNENTPMMIYSETESGNYEYALVHFPTTKYSNDIDEFSDDSSYLSINHVPALLPCRFQVVSALKQYRSKNNLEV